MLAPAGVAWAQDEEEAGEEEAASEEGASEEGASEEGAEASSEEAATEEEAPAAGGRWPRANIARPLTLPKGLINAGGTINGLAKFETFTLGLNGGYGVSDDLEVRLSYGLTLKEFEAKGPLAFEVGYKILRGAAGGKLEVIGRVGTGYDLALEGLAPLVAGAQVQYNISDKLAVVSSGKHLNISLEEASSGVAPAPVVTIRPIFLSLPVGVGYQATPELYAQIDTNIGNIEISDAPTTFIFADFIPLTASFVYNLQPALDITASFGFTDLKNNAGDNITASIGAQYYIGAL
ncbi:MAG: hypothetical protein IPI49_25870 [Myxococcales bacterium]|nr:hypothetical protein [Myxococcales bacterium]